MAAFTLRLDSPHPSKETWARVVDWKRHGLVAPLTKVVVAGGASRVEPDVPVVGERFVAHTGVGPLKIDDAMRVSSVDISRETRSVDVEKVGRLLKGKVHISVAPIDGNHAVLTWKQSFRIAVLPKALNRVLAPALSTLVGLGYRYALRKLVA